MGKQMIEIRVEGREMCSDDDLEEMSLSSRLLAQAGLTLTRSYRNGETCLQVEVVTVSGKLGMLDGECLKKEG